MAGVHQGGVLDRRIDILRLVTVVTSYNEPVDTFTTIATLYAKRTDVSAREGYRAAEVGGEISCRFVIRFSAFAQSVSVKDRIAYGGREYNITGVREIADMRSRYIEIDAVARAET